MKDNLKEILSKDDARLYFVGIGGIAMSAAACLAKDFGYEVTGSDSNEIYDPAKSVLESFKINYNSGYELKNVETAKADLFVISAGEDLSNPEVKYVYDNNLPHCSFAEVLEIFADDDLRIVVTGTHGKSTTSGLLGHIFKNLDNSSFIVGAVLQNYQTNFHKGDGHYFVFEGDEYKSEWDDPTPKFHYYKPDILVLTNLEYDHPDMFGSFEELKTEFRELISNLPEDGLIVYNADDPELAKLVHESNVTSVSFGLQNEADYFAESISYEKESTTINVKNKYSKDNVAELLGKAEEYKIQLPGEINVYNALAAIATLRVLGFSRENIALDLLSYLGVKRRFEKVGVKNGITLIDDYAHHPTAVRETLEAVRLRYPNSKLWAVFEPHTFSRTKATLDDLAKSFGSADEVLISEIYPAREKKSDATITSDAVVSAVGRQHQKVRLVHNKQEALDILKSEAKSGDVIIVMAVGDFNRLAYDLKEKL